MKYEEIEPYLIDFIKGEADEATEYRIKAYLQQNPDFQEELDELKTTLEYTQELPLATPPTSLKLDFYAMLNEAKAAEKIPAPKVAWWTVFQNNWLRGLALASVVVFVFFTGYWSSLWLKPDFATQASEEMSLKTVPENSKKAEETAEKMKEDAENDAVLEEPLNSEEVKETQAEMPRENTENATPAPKLVRKSAQDQKTEQKIIVQSSPQNEDTYQKLGENADRWIENDTQSIKKKPELNSEKTNSPQLSNRSYQDESELAESKLSTERKKTTSIGSKDSKEDLQTVIDNFKTHAEVSVRLANLKKLEADFLADKAVQDILFEQLIVEKNLEVQMAILEVIDANQLKRAKKALKKLTENTRTNTTVKQKAQKLLDSF